LDWKAPGFIKRSKNKDKQNPRFLSSAFLRACEAPGRVEISQHAVSRKIKKGSLLLNAKTRLCYRLDETGSRLWELLCSGAGFTKALCAIKREYDVPDEILRKDISRLARQLTSAGFLRT